MDDPKEWKRQLCEGIVDDWKRKRQQRLDAFTKGVMDLIQQKYAEWCGTEEGWREMLKQIVGSKLADEVANELKDARRSEIGEQIMKNFLLVSNDELTPPSSMQGDDTVQPGYIRFLNFSPPQSPQDTSTEMSINGNVDGFSSTVSFLLFYFRNRRIFL